MLYVTTRSAEETYTSSKPLSDSRATDGGFFVPILVEYINTGLVPNFPTLIVCGFTAIAALLSFFAGVQLQNAVQKNKQDFELQRIRVNQEMRTMLDPEDHR